MQDELPVVITQERHEFQAITPLFPNVTGRGSTQTEAVQALLTAISKRSSGRRTPPLVTNVQLRFQKFR